MINQHNTNIIEKYNQLFYQTKDLEWFIFMNDGYTPLDECGYPVDNLNYPTLNPLHAKWKYQAYLYFELLRCANISTPLGDVLDIGCGRGGGLSVYRDYCNSSSLTGLDLNPNQISFCKKTHPNISFLQGSAMELPFADNSFDIITNVESANYYILYGDFVADVARVLKPNGFFLYADTFTNDRLELVKQVFSDNGLTIVSVNDITRNVRVSCSIEKYRLLDKSAVLADVMMWDEERYYSARHPSLPSYNADYYILVIQKPNS
jgi:ubiquinone/menaquinone biosynthesis C-methylase UbiE